MSRRRGPLRLGLGLGFRAAGGGGGAAPPGEFSIADMDTLSWYEPDDADNFTLSTALVDQWNDLSGNGNHIARTGTARPTRETSVASMNNLPAVLFDGSDDNLHLGSLTGYPADNRMAVTVVAVVRPTSLTSRAVCCFSSNGGNNNTGQLQFETSPNLAVRSGGIIDATVGSFSTDTTVLISGVFQYNLRRAWKNGTPGTLSTVEGNPTAHTQFEMGALGGPIFLFAGHIGELVVLQGADLARRQLVEGKLAWKWGLDGDLASGHPFENDEPTAADAIADPDFAVQPSGAGTIAGNFSGTSGGGTLPGGRSNGDLLIAMVQTVGGNNTFTIGSGWTIVDQINDANTSSAVAWYIVDGAEATPSFSWTNDAGVWHAHTFLLRGNHASAPIGNKSKAVGSGTTLAVNPVEDLTAGSVVVACLFSDGDNAMIPASFGAVAATYHDANCSDVALLEYPPGDAADSAGVSVTISNVAWSGIVFEVKKA